MATTQSMQIETFGASGMVENKPTIPVVTHVITDEDIGALQVRCQFLYSDTLLCF